MAESSVMCGYLLVGHGGPEALVYREDLPVPAPGQGEVLIRVGACAINNTDIWTREGAYGGEADARATAGWRREPLAFPRIQGADVAGTVAAVGEGVDEDRLGTRVVVNPVLYADEGGGLIGCRFLGSEIDGGFAQYCVVPESNAVAAGDRLDDVQWASFPTAYLTAEHMLNRARVSAGERVLVTGASGGVGSALVQLAAARGASPFAVVGQGKEDGVLRIGAEAAFLRGDGLFESIHAALGETPFDVVADVVGGDVFHGLLSVLRPGGRYVTAGAIAGALVELDLRTLYLKHLELIGSTLGTRDEFAAVVEHAQAGRIVPLVGGVYTLEDLPRAQADFLEKNFTGKLVLVP